MELFDNKRPLPQCLQSLKIDCAHSIRDSPLEVSYVYSVDAASLHLESNEKLQIHQLLLLHIELQLTSLGKKHIYTNWE